MHVLDLYALTPATGDFAARVYRLWSQQPGADRTMTGSEDCMYSVLQAIRSHDGLDA